MDHHPSAVVTTESTVGQLYTTDEVAKLLRVSQRTVQVWIRDGMLTAIKYGRLLRVRQADLATFGEVLNQRTAPLSPRTSAAVPLRLARLRSERLRACVAGQGRHGVHLMSTFGAPAPDASFFWAAAHSGGWPGQTRGVAAVRPGGSRGRRCRVSSRAESLVWGPWRCRRSVLLQKHETTLQGMRQRDEACLVEARIESIISSCSDSVMFALSQSYYPKIRKGVFHGTRLFSRRYYPKV